MAPSPSGGTAIAFALMRRQTIVAEVVEFVATTVQSRGLRPLAVHHSVSRAARCRRMFLRKFHGAFRDDAYLAQERIAKWQAHEQWESLLGRTAMRAMVRSHEFEEIADLATQIETRSGLLNSGERITLREAVKTAAGSRIFSIGLYDFLYGAGSQRHQFERWTDAMGELPKRQARILTWPMITVFGFLAQPDMHLYLRPAILCAAAE